MHRTDMMQTFSPQELLMLHVTLKPKRRPRVRLHPALAAPVAALTAASIVAAVLPRWSQAWHPAAGPGVSRLPERRARLEAQVARSPRDLRLRLKLADCLIRTGTYQAYEAVEASGMSPTEPEDYAYRWQVRRALECSPELEAARVAAWQVLHASAEPQIRARAWEILAKRAARLDDVEERDRCFAAADREYARLSASPQSAARPQ
jgi:hypothetical protein